MTYWLYICLPYVGCIFVWHMSVVYLFDICRCHVLYDIQIVEYSSEISVINVFYFNFRKHNHMILKANISLVVNGGTYIIILLSICFTFLSTFQISKSYEQTKREMYDI